jgi:hypothetical protein
MGPSWRHLLLIMGLIIMTLPGLCRADGLASPTGDPLWGPSWEGRQQSEEVAIARYNYCPTGGCVVRLESLEISPIRTKRGEKIHLTTAYTILTPERLPIPVTLTREIFYQGKSLGKVMVMETRQGNGTWENKIDFSLPANAAPGSYTMVTRITTGYGSDLKSGQFVVE